MTKMNGQAFIEKAGDVGKIFPNNKMKEMSGFPGISFVIFAMFFAIIIEKIRNGCTTIKIAILVLGTNNKER